MSSTNYLKNGVSSRLKPFNWATENEIRRSDIAVFNAAACVYEHIILLRATNPFSIPFIGSKNHTPKPIDCKPKTASKHAYYRSQLIQCAGLVVDPTRLRDAFDSAKCCKAESMWREFIRGYGDYKGGFKFIPRHDHAGFYSVDTYKASPLYGCLMLSKINIPSRDFDLSLDRWQDFKKNSMSYIHGDYDLYGLIDCVEAEKVWKNSNGGMLSNKNLVKSILLGTDHYYSKHFYEIKQFLNNGVGVDMIQHGAQDNIGHSKDKLYVFTPGDGFYVLDESEKVVREVYRLVFKEEPVEGSF